MTNVNNTSDALETMHALDVQVGKRSASVNDDNESVGDYLDCFPSHASSTCQEWFDV